MKCTINLFYHILQKISAKNAFGLHLIDYMAEMLRKRGEMMNFQVILNGGILYQMMLCGSIFVPHFHLYMYLYVSHITYTFPSLTVVY